MMTAVLRGDVAPGHAESDRLVRFAFWLTVGLLVVRLAVLGRFGLFFDEVYYWLWSTQLAGSYYDHPPMVAFFIRMGTLLFGDNEFGVRVFGAVSVAIDAGLVYAITRTLTDDRRLAAWAAVFMNVTTLSAFAVIIVPDQPMMMFWLIALLALAKIAKGGHGGWWLLVGLAGGLAASSKLTTFFLAMAVPIWLVVTPSLRRWFRSPWPYLGLAAAVVAFSPVLVWNAQNDWVSFTLQYGREQFESPRIASFFQFLTLWPLMITPPILVLAGMGLARIARRGWLADPVRSLLVVTPIPLFVYFVYHSLGEWIGAHWIAPLAAIATIYAAIAIGEDWRGLWYRLAVICRKIAIPVGAAVTLAFYVLLLEDVLPISRADDLTARFRGWQDYAENQEAARVAAGADYILGPDYASPAYIRFYLDDPPPAYQIGDFVRWRYFEGLGTAAPALADATGIYVGKWGVDYEIEFIGQFFETVIRMDPADVVRPIRPDVIIEDPVYIVRDPKPAAMALFGLPEEAN